MHIISIRRLREFWEKHNQAEGALRAWYIRVQQAQWRNFAEVRADFPSADQVQRLTVFNIAGNNYRLITRIEYVQQKVYVRAVLTHAEYDKEGWKMTLGTIEQEANYRALVMTFPPRVIHDEAEYQVVQEKVDHLVDQANLTPAEQEYLDLLGTLIWEYEQRTESAAEYELRGVTLVQGLMELHNLKQQDLVPIFKTKSIVSAVLNGKRKLTAEHIDKLAAFFRLPHGLFFEPAPGIASVQSDTL